MAFLRIFKKTIWQDLWFRLRLGFWETFNPAQKCHWFEFEQDGFTVYWTGWIMSQSNRAIVGYWVAYQPKNLIFKGKNHFVVTVPMMRTQWLEAGEEIDLTGACEFDLELRTKRGRDKLCRRGRNLMVMKLLFMCLSEKD